MLDLGTGRGAGLGRGDRYRGEPPNPATALAGFVAIGWIVLRIGRQTPLPAWILAAFGVQTVAESVYLVAALNGAESDQPDLVAYAATGWLWALAGAARCQAGPRRGPPAATRTRRPGARPSPPPSG